ncbi:MAG: oxidoreductase domain-containing protein [Candidatus Magnetoglobus multicellularis str. Araruama]|uniref:Oxidoreductase domain-containing protein n=1 Tax=Candidatus Magnetoglobus multicellularis str. Araruama TaxID=890399 RepID=A0A1V1P6C5_9BACT|nr:MAG: oxidoreductase domain-containing protein [Candidatus Magnetoglobus multicellularis str. Araruama]
MSKIKVGVIGVGYLGKFHAQKYAKMPHVDLVGVADINKENVEKVALDCGTKAFTNFRDLFGQIDAASIVVPTELHYSVARDCLENNIDVLIEKPITYNLEQAEELLVVAKNRNLLIQVGHLERFNPVVLAIRDMIQRPVFIESHRLSPYKGRGIDVSVVLDLMIHDIDIIRNFVQSDVKWIQAAGVPVICSDVDIANARLEFEQGCIANVTASRISMKEERKLRIFQKDAYVSVDFATKDITCIRRNENVTDSIIPGMEIQKLHFDEGDALNAEIESFLNCVQQRTTPEVPGQAGRDALAIAIDIMAQIKTRSERLEKMETMTL